jgi:hypothetical protein
LCLHLLLARLSHLVALTTHGEGDHEERRAHNPRGHDDGQPVQPRRWRRVGPPEVVCPQLV